MDEGSNITKESSLSCARCGKPAHLQCPKCVELKLPRGDAAFCSQDCFKAAWSSHKSVHLRIESQPLRADASDDQTSAALKRGWLYCLKKGQARTAKLPHFDWTGCVWNDLYVQLSMLVFYRWHMCFCILPFKMDWKISANRDIEDFLLCISSAYL
ncbi:methionine aminopeptidase 1A-like [Amborella trichopoda]|uniref:methionine aminopeptidase 1A-like n=1 Tax=Amborella trichopoda TaxID=13333 RepID=UPI0009BD4D37|nr:methionine aminopeptidase 1A-like [Amborella trichopoda]XP_020520225.1 methionine aminopeptidase 1A-like [Amborella trichopoda]|eukprot:XP_020520224.1 methionine aminopeptidase 1A-like [Amborella trichopoda]